MQVGMRGHGGLGASTLWTPPGPAPSGGGWGAQASFGGCFSAGNPYAGNGAWSQQQFQHFGPGNGMYAGSNGLSPWVPMDGTAAQQQIPAHCSPTPTTAPGQLPAILRPRQPKSMGLAAEEAAQYCKAHQISIVAPKGDFEHPVPTVIARFEDADLPEKVCQEIRAAGFTAPTAIQAQVLPVLRAGHDMIGISKAGSGKTLAFLAPAFAHVLDFPPVDPKVGPSLLALAPTRELVTQIQIEALTFGRSAGILSCAVYGGASRASQLEWVQQGCHLVVATPGRLNDLLESGQLRLSQVTYLVLDEADRMLDMGFEPQIRRAISKAPRDRQTALFSATWPKEVRKLAHEFLTRPVEVRIGEMEETHANVNVTQDVVVVDGTPEKDAALERVLSRELVAPTDKCIIFVSTKQMCRSLAWRLQRPPAPAQPPTERSPSSPSAGGGPREEDLSAAGTPSPEAEAAGWRPRACVQIHGDKDQRERDQALQAFKDGKSPIMIATDVAGRGLHIENVKLVVNFDAAGNAEEHVHRIGRTGRAGAKGKSITFLCRNVPGDVAKAKWLCDLIERSAAEADEAPGIPDALRELRHSRSGAAEELTGGGRSWSSGKGKGGKRGGKGAKGGKGVKGS